MKKLCVVNLSESKQPLSTCATPSETSASDREDAVCGGEKRKRQRLGHLTAEEKLMRRKLKNRAAAQAARDRKRDKFEDLHVAVRECGRENERLRRENALLKEKAQILIEENRRLLRFKEEAEARARESETQTATAFTLAIRHG